MTASPAPSIKPSRMLAAIPRVVGRMIRLQTHRQPSRQSDGVSETCYHDTFSRNQ
jgi:hypothetical protein